MSIYSILNIANNSLKATQTSIQITSNNIANVSTPGYAREEAVLEEEKPVPSGSMLIGDGVKVKTIKRYSDSYLDLSIQKKNTTLQEQSDLSAYLQQIQSYLDEDNSHLTSYTTTFFNNWQNLSTDPQSSGMKGTVLAAGQNLAQSISSVRTEIKSLQADINGTVQQTVTEVNGLLSDIASLNKLIVDAQGTGAQANSYIDQKTDLLNQLSKKIGITTFDDANGVTTVLSSSGKPLVENDSAWGLATTPDQTTGYYRVAWKDSSGNLYDITDSLAGGSLKAAIDTRDDYAVQFLGNLDALSQTLLDNVKWTIKGSTTATSFFSGTGAGDIAVSSDLVADPTRIAASSDPVNKPTGNDIALAMAALYDENLLGTKQLSHKSGSDALGDTFADPTQAVGTLLSPPSSSSGTISIKGKTYNIDLATQSLDTIAANINASPPTGVTASVVSSTQNGVTVYRLKLTNVGASDLTDQGNVLQTLGVMEGTSTFTNYTSAMVSKIGEMTSGAKNADQYNQDTLTILQQQRESVSGVSIDEEMANLIKYQYAYQASAKLFTVADELLQSLLGVVR